MEHFSFHHPKMDVFVADRTKASGVAKGKPRIAVRKTLADISNIPQRVTASSEVNKPRQSSDATRQIIEQLQKENAGLLKLLADKNKLIELSGAEVQKMRATLQIVKQQNLQLAQSNSQIQAELNLVREMQKSLKHELGCKSALIIAKNLELEGNAKTNMCQINENVTGNVTEPEEKEVIQVAESDNDSSRTQKSKSLVPSVEKIQDTDVTKARRIQTRRQSARFKLNEPKPTELAIKIENEDGCPPCSLPDDDNMKVNDSNSVPSSSKKENIEGLVPFVDKIQDNDVAKARRIQTRRNFARSELDEPKPTEIAIRIENVEDLPPCPLPDDDNMVNHLNSVPSSSKKEVTEGDSLEDNKPQELRKPSFSRPVREARRKVQSYKEVNLVVKMRRE
uniref:SHUGOSHIN 2-like n=1 Tax=Erigeron canadensis TaxID=72917 RepID=UPI001CB9B3BC|nr:SHUGOSHIN 2-like [Erigeron canadensis]